MQHRRYRARFSYYPPQGQTPDTTSCLVPPLLCFPSTLASSPFHHTFPSSHFPSISLLSPKQLVLLHISAFIFSFERRIHIARSVSVVSNAAIGTACVQTDESGLLQSRPLSYEESYDTHDQLYAHTTLAAALTQTGAFHPISLIRSWRPWGARPELARGVNVCVHTCKWGAPCQGLYLQSEDLSL